MGNNGAGPRNSGSGHYRQEAGLLERTLATETDPFLVARYKFYLAQSHLDAGDKEKALAAYHERAALGLWDQEVFISLYRSAGIEADLGFDEDAVIASYLLAHEARKGSRGGAPWRSAVLPSERALPAGVRPGEARHSDQASRQRPHPGTLDLRVRCARRIRHQCLLDRPLRRVPQVVPEDPRHSDLGGRRAQANPGERRFRQAEAERRGPCRWSTRGRSQTLRPIGENDTMNAETLPKGWPAPSAAHSPA
jgi:hypothetical protein